MRNHTLAVFLMCKTLPEQHSINKESGADWEMKQADKEKQMKKGIKAMRAHCEVHSLNHSAVRWMKKPSVNT